MELINDANTLRNLVREIDELCMHINKNARTEQRLRDYNKLSTLRNSAEELFNEIDKNVKNIDFGKIKNKNDFDKIKEYIDRMGDPTMHLSETLELYINIIKIANCIEDKPASVSVINSDVLVEVFD